jgi:hypothetical protein
MHTGRLCKNQIFTYACATFYFQTMELELSVRIPENMILETKKRCLILLVPPVYFPPTVQIFYKKQRLVYFRVVFAMKPLKIVVHRTKNVSSLCIGAKLILLP